MRRKKIVTGIAVLKNGPTELIDGAVITSYDDEAVGTYCPNCKKTEITYIDISNQADTQEKRGGEERQKWWVNGCMCRACHSYWTLYSDEIGRRVLIYDRKKRNPIGPC